MGKQGKKAGHRQKATRREAFNSHEEGDHETSLYNESTNVGQDPIDSLASHLSLSDQSEEEKEPFEEKRNGQYNLQKNITSKFCLYQHSVQCPKGEIRYLEKFFLNYVGGKLPLCLQEDFCGTARLSTEWLLSDTRRTAIGMDLDKEALTWCIENNLYETGLEDCSRISLFHGNVLHPLEAELVLSEHRRSTEEAIEPEEGEEGSVKSTGSKSIFMKDMSLPAPDIICAFNYSCCCLHSRRELVSYFKNAFVALSEKSGIFVMDLYGGTSSECALKLQRKFSTFMYTWEQAEFDIIKRLTRISIHYRLLNQKKIQNAFSYSWRLWTLPEIKECLEEAGFRSVHFWMREMPASNEIRSTIGFGSGHELEYEEVSSFEQTDSWSAYIVAVA